MSGAAELGQLGSTLTVDANNNVSVPNTFSMGSSFLRNRIINGDMRIDQRNAGASVSVALGAYNFAVDRWNCFIQSGSGHTIQQVSDAPAGFRNSFRLTVGTGGAPAAGNQGIIWQAIEGYNIADLGFGAAGASSFTVSFWFKSSITGTYTAWFANAGLRSYVATFTVSAANTWEYKTLTIAGDTASTWNTTNGSGLSFGINVGSGTTFQTTAGSWQSNDFRTVSGAVSPISTTGATVQITGVQLEAGSVATPFERRQYGQELALCQRYYFRYKAAAINDVFSTGQCISTLVSIGLMKFPVSMRSAPTALEQSGTAANYQMLTAASVWTACNSVPAFNSATTELGTVTFTVASGMVAGNATLQSGASTSAYLGWSAEL